MALGKESLEVKITVDSADAIKSVQDFMRALQAGATSTKTTTDKAKQSVDGLSDSAKKAKDENVGFGSTLKAGFEKLFLPVTALNQAFGVLGTVMGQLGAVMEKTVGSANRLGLSVAQINTLLTENERKTFDASAAILGLQAELGGNQQDIARGFYETLASGAVSVGKSHQFMRDAMKLAVGGLTDVTTAQKILTAVTAAFGEEAGSTTHVADALFIAAAQGATDIKQLATDLGGAIGTAKTLGVSFDELVSFVSALTLQGITTAESVTSVNSAMIALARQTPDLTSALKDLYSEDIRTVIQQKGLVRVLREVTQATGGSAEAVINLMGRTEALKAISGATSKEIGTKFNTMYQDVKASLNNVGAASGNAFKLINETTSRQIDIFKSRLDVLFTSTSKGLSDALGSLLTGINSVLEYAIKLGDAFSRIDLAAIFKSALPWILAVSVALTPTAIMGAVQAWTAFGPAIISATTAMKGFLVVGLKVALIAASIGTVVVAIDFLIRNVNKLEEIFTVAIDTIILGVLNLKGTLLNLIPGIDTSALTETANQIQEVEDQIGKTLAKADFDTGLGGALFDGIQSFMGAFSEANKDVQNALTETAKVAEKVKPPKPPDEETMRRYNALKGELDNWKNSLDKVGQTEEQAAKAIAARQILEIQGVKKLLKEESRLTGERRKFLAEAEATVKKRLDAELKVIEEKRQKEARDASIEAAKLIGDQTTAINLEYQKQLEAWQKLVDERKLSQEQFNKVSIQLEKDRQEALKALEPKKQRGLGVAASIVEGVKGGAAGLTSTITELSTASHKAQLEADLANKKITQSAFNTSIANIGWIGQIIKGIIDIFGKSEDEFRQFVQGLLQTANKLPIQIFKNIPALIEELINNIPGALDDALQGIVASTVGLVAGIVKAAFKTFPGLIKTLFSAQFWNEVVFGFLRAMRDAIYEIGDTLAEAFSGKFDVGKGLKEALDPTALVKSLSGVSEQLFSVLDATAGAKGDNAAAQIAKAIGTSTKQGVNALTRVWDALKRAWTWIDSTILQPFGKMLEPAWALVKDTVLTPFIDSLKATWDFARTVFDDPIAAFRGLLNSAKSILGNIVAGLVAWTENAGQAFVDGVVSAFNGAVQAIQNVGTWIVDGFVAGMEAQVSWLNTVGTWIVDGMQSSLEAGMSWFDQAGVWMWNGFVGAGDAAVDWLTGLGGNVWTGFAGGEGIGATLSSWGNSIWTGLTSAVEAAPEFLSGLGSKIWSGLVSAVSGLEDFGDKIWSGFLRGANSIVDWSKEFPQKIVDAVKQGLAKSTEWFTQIGSAIWEAIKDPKGTFLNFKDAGAKAWESFTNIGEKGWTHLKSLGSKVWEGLSDGLSNATESMKSIGTRIWDGLAAKLNDVGNLLAKMFKFDGGGMDTVEKFLGMDFPFVSFATGGLVPGYASTPGDSKKNDRIPAMLSPGEIVVPRSVLDSNDGLRSVLLDAIGGRKVEFAAGGLLGEFKKKLKPPKPKDLLPVVVGLPPKTPLPPVVEKAAEKVIEVAIPGDIKAMFDSLVRFVPSIDLMQMVKDPRGAIEGAIRSSGAFNPFVKKVLKGFADGGLVGSDTVPAMLTPGEYVLNRDTVGRLGAPLLNKINAGGSVGDTNVNVTLNIKTEQPIDESFVRSKIMPTIKNEFRRASLDGRRILAPSGVR